MSNLLEHTKHVSLELHNRCNLSHLHAKCPVGRNRGDGLGPVFLPEWVYHDILTTLGEEGYRGVIGFHNYCEPMIDPRLFRFFALARYLVPHCHLFFLTNGTMMTQGMLEELHAIGVNEIRVSGYSSAEITRLAALTSPDPATLDYSVHRVELDNRMLIYDEWPIIDSADPCYSPLADILVLCDGRVALCCRDWKGTYTFGNIQEQTFRSILESGEMQEVFRRLSSGDRFLDICRRCPWRGRYGPDYPLKGV